MDLTNLIALYECDEASGNLTDAHGGITLTQSGSVGATTGVISGARTYNGSSAYHETADSATLSLGSDTSMTAHCWVKFSSKSSYMWLIARDDAVSNREWGLLYDSGSDRFGFYTYVGSYSPVLANSFGSPSTGVWYWVCGWHDAAANELGITVGSGGSLSSETPASWSSGTQNTAAPFTVGGYGFHSFGTVGDIDQAGYWKRVLNSTERSEIYNSGSGRAYPWTVATGKAHAPYRRPMRFFRRAS